METLSSVKKMQDLALSKNKAGIRIGFVPTMGFLHEGHLQLIDVAKKNSDWVVLSIFVNPTQFAPNEDLDRYPRDLARDQKLAAARGVDVCFTPTAEEIYPGGDQSVVLLTELTRGLCGPFRPGHFRGVTTVVAKLFNLVRPDVAIFGEKDYQQLRVLSKMVEDLHFPIEILAVPTFRETDGLAMSSRNVYLSSAERQEATHIVQGLRKAQEALAKGKTSSKQLIQLAKEAMVSGGNIQLEYLEIVDANSLAAVDQVIQPSRILTAVRLNQNRLIDNLPLNP